MHGPSTATTRLTADSACHQAGSEPDVRESQHVCESEGMQTSVLASCVGWAIFAAARATPWASVYVSHRQVVLVQRHPGRGFARDLARILFRAGGSAVKLLRSHSTHPPAGPWRNGGGRGTGDARRACGPAGRGAAVRSHARRDGFMLFHQHVLRLQAAWPHSTACRLSRRRSSTWTCQTSRYWVRVCTLRST